MLCWKGQLYVCFDFDAWIAKGNILADVKKQLFAKKLFYAWFNLVLMAPWIAQRIQLLKFNYISFP